MRKDSREIGEIVDKKNRFLVVGHQKPDGDSLGSTLALTYMLRSLGKEVFPICKDIPADVFSSLPEVASISQDLPSVTSVEAVFVLDNIPQLTGLLDNVPWFFRDFDPIVEIDHHRKAYNEDHLHYHSESASSTCELLWEFANERKIEITPLMATHLITGIYTDTSAFINDNVTEKTLTITADLLEKGADPTFGIYIIEEKNPGFLRSLGRTLRRLKLNERSKIASTFLAYQDFIDLRVTPDDTAGISNFLSSVEEADITLLLMEQVKGKLEGSMRSRGDADVSKLAKLFSPHGGGHAKAAGFSLSGTFEKDTHGEWKILPA